MPHTGATLRLRAEVIESELLFHAGLSCMQAMSALHAHPNADVEKGSEQQQVLYMDALANIPYLTGGRTGQDAVGAERDASIQKYRDMKKRMLKDPPPE